MPLGQDNELAVFLVVLAVIFVIVIALALGAIARRNKRGRTVENSTFGNNVEGDKEVPTNRSTTEYPANAGAYDNSQPGTARQDNLQEPSPMRGSRTDPGGRRES
ncbi:MAG: hypothetical protein ACJ788_13245 [Ktedonobacteraceae bacterium]|jgi:hypothetical protein